MSAKTIFDETIQIAEDYKVLWLAIKSSRSDMQSVTEAAAERISEEKKAHAERCALLEQQSVDEERPEVVRRLALQELERERGRVFGPTPDEENAFAKALDECEEARADAIKLKGKLSDSLRAAKSELERLKSASYDYGGAGGDLEQLKTWIEGERRDFERLYPKEARA